MTERPSEKDTPSILNDGLRAAWPICVGYVPIGLAFGVLAQKAGLSALAVGLMSALVFAGSSQFIAVAMLGAGFLVATGRATDDKPESTVAFTPGALDHGRARRHELLGADWLVRWERSGARYPSDLPEADRGAFEETILRHQQFRGLRPGKVRGGP